jgi:lactoylglutathione lyase
MTRFDTLTPNLVVSDIDRSLVFYRDVLGLSVVTTVPEVAPFVFVWLERDGLRVFLNASEAARAEYPAIVARGNAGSWTMFVVVDDVDGLHQALAERVEIVMPLETKFYGMREFAILDPDGFVITFAQRMSKD